MILLKIAFRNLREHKVKTLIIGTLVAIGIAFLVMGNSVMESITRGMEATYIENFTGDLILRNTSEDEVFFIGGFGAPPEVLANYPDIAATLEAMPEVETFAPLVTGFASISQNDETLSIALLWGVEPSSYFAMFPDRFQVTDGRMLQDGEQGIVLARDIIDEIADEQGVELHVGDKIVLAGRNDVTGTKIREVPIVGIGAYENAAGLLGRISFVDVTTLRALTGLTAVQVERQPADAGADEAFSEDALFGDSLVKEADTADESALDFDRILGDTSVREQYLALDNNAWHFVTIDVADGVDPAVVAARLGSIPGISDSLVVEDWRWGAGFLADLAFGIRNILNIIILVIAIVAVIIIMNTLVISVTERINEIGTVRAIGGQKSFVRGMIIIEVLMITVVFGIVGMALGSLVIGIFNVIGLPAGNLFLQILFGGPVLKPILSVGSLFTSLIIVAVIGVVASLYPVSVALGIPPVRAMQQN